MRSRDKRSTALSRRSSSSTEHESELMESVPSDRLSIQKEEYPNYDRVLNPQKTLGGHFRKVFRLIIVKWISSRAFDNTCIDA